MPINPTFRTFVLEQLERVATQIRSKSMFGGVGIYSQDLFFALIADDELFLKVNDTNRPDFEALGIGPFRPFGPDGEVMQYYPIPADVLEDPDVLQLWVDKAIDVARSKKKSPRRAGQG
jgi:DNA transformation protein